MKNIFLSGIALLILAACSNSNSSLQNALVVGSIRGPLYVPHSSVINSDGVELQVKLPFSSSTQAEWSRDHVWIALATDHPNKAEIILIDGRKNLRIQLTDYHNGESYDPSWSPDGNRIAYFSYDADGDQDGIYVTDVSCLRENSKCSLTPKFLVHGYSPSWSPDGQRLVFEKFDHQIATVEINNSMELTSVISDMHCQDPKWSPIGGRIIASCFQDNDIDIFLAHVDGSNLINLTGGKGSNTNPVWSPDGQEIAFVSDRETTGMLSFDDTVKSNSVYVMNVDGSNVERVTTQNHENIRWLTWVYP